MNRLDDRGIIGATVELLPYPIILTGHARAAIHGNKVLESKIRRVWSVNTSYCIKILTIHPENLPQR
jgi:hypothetical protein